MISILGVFRAEQKNKAGTRKDRRDRPFTSYKTGQRSPLPGVSSLLPSVCIGCRGWGMQTVHGPLGRRSEVTERERVV